KRSVLAISGGGSYGAYSAGILCGWTQAGTRPQFDVVTGISTGALIAPLAFLGPAYDAELERFYTTVRNDDIYAKRGVIRALAGSSFADTAPLRRLVEATITPDLLRAVAAEHEKGRRLYVGTTDLEGRRPVVWDVGAIAARGTPADRKLVVDVLLASAAIPGFFPPVPLTVEAGGRTTTEKHVDGGVSASLFFVPPHVPPEERASLPRGWLYGSDLYLLVSGKLYADPEPCPPESLRIAGGAITTVLYAQTRGDLQRLFTVSMLTGMNYHLAAIPADFDAPTSATDFDPAKMRRMFDEGRRQVLAGTAWQAGPPGLGKEATCVVRAGTSLVAGGGGPAVVSPGVAGFPVMTQEGIPVPAMPVTK
ncbi:MAG TPA: patatin-like phospholipase family protein, partial [Gemmata sp.]|nr:patatin-like phospholipase family protein [Gemmata sp.]